MSGLVTKKGKLSYRGKFVAKAIGAVVGWYVTGPIVEAMIKKVAR